VVVDHEGDIVHYSPRTGKYLEPASGLPSRQLLAMARRGLRLDLRAAFREALEGRRHVERREIAIEIDDRIQKVDLVVEPLGAPDSEPLFLVLFRDVGEPFTPSEAEQLRKADDSGGHVERLEQELRDTRERLQATVEEYETAVEELKSSNEELQSVNEELQSTNEELETSKEELQSLNEELHTVNSELTAKVEEVDRAHADLRNIFESTRIATVFLDKNLGIRSFTPAVTEIFNLISTDRGRPLTDISSNLEDVDLRRDVQTVFERGEIIERNVRRADGKTHYLMRILPYRAYNNVIEGVLVTFVEVTKMVESETQQRTLVEELDHRVRNMLSVVNAIATQTMRHHRSPDRFVEAFTGRIRAMGAAYTLVSSRNWTEVPLFDLIREQIQPAQAQGDARIRLQGSDYNMVPSAALSLSLVMHELATNAVKHGALSAVDGSVSVTWRSREQSAMSLEILWRERGGPAQKKTRQRGFGTELIEREIKGTLQGSVTTDHLEDGTTVTILFPMIGNVVVAGR
jgi:two-component system, chemotaxis family, CheB/CheR fusion protein